MTIINCDNIRLINTDMRLLSLLKINQVPVNYLDYSITATNLILFSAAEFISVNIAFNEVKNSLIKEIN